MDKFDEADFKVQTQNMYKLGGVPNVMDCVIMMIEAQLVILRKLKEITSRTGD